MDLRRYLLGALSAGLSAVVAYLSANFIGLDLGPLEPFRMVIALLAVALFNRFKPKP